MSSPVAIPASNQFDALGSPRDESKLAESARGMKDDMKEQAFQAREGIKQRASQIKEKVVDSIEHGKEALSETIEEVSAAADGFKQKMREGGSQQKDASSSGEKAPLGDKKAAAHEKGEELAEAFEGAKEKVAEEWETVKRKGAKQMSHAKQSVGQMLDENLSHEQRQKLNRAAKAAKQSAIRMERRAEGFSDQVVDSVLTGPRLRPVKSFIRRNSLQLPAVIFASFISLWFGLTLIRLMTSMAAPHAPELDIHSKDASVDWLKYHAGDFKNKAADLEKTLSARAASFLSNNDLSTLKRDAINWRDIGMKQLGLAEPTWSEWAFGRLTGRPVGWQERVDRVLELAKSGINRPDIIAQGSGFVQRDKGDMKETIESMKEKADEVVDSIRAHLPTASEAVDAARERASEAVDAARERAYEATHPSTFDKLKSGATYLKNRVVHGAEKAAHLAQDKVNEITDEAKFRASQGL